MTNIVKRLLPIRAVVFVIVVGKVAPETIAAMYRAAASDDQQGPASIFMD